MKMTSWTDRNLVRQFWTCSRFGGRCGFLGWAEPPMCRRAMVVIPSLLRAMTRL